jgi:hypothetical protein
MTRRPWRRRRPGAGCRRARSAWFTLRVREWPNALDDLRRWRDRETDPVIFNWLARAYRRVEHEEFPG